MSILSDQQKQGVKKLLDFLEKDDEIKKSLPDIVDIESRMNARKPTLVNLENTVLVAENYGFANCMMINGKDGLVFVDTTEKMEVAAKIKEDYFSHPAVVDKHGKEPNSMSNKIKGMIYTHFHADHTFGGRALFSDFIGHDDTAENWKGPPLWASEHFYNSHVELDGNIRPMYFLRGARQ